MIGVIKEKLGVYTIDQLNLLVLKASAEGNAGMQTVLCGVL